MADTRSSFLRRTFRTRFWVEFALSVVSVALLLLTLLVPDWIEAILRVDPDQHNGSVEWGIAGFLLAVALAAGTLTRFEWRSAHRYAHAQPGSPSADSR